MSWVKEVATSNYGMCIVLNDNTKLEPVKCDSKHNTICSVNNSLLTNNTKTDSLSEDSNNTHKPSKGKGFITFLIF